MKGHEVLCSRFLCGIARGSWGLITAPCTILESAKCFHDLHCSSARRRCNISACCFCTVLWSSAIWWRSSGLEEPLARGLAAGRADACATAGSTRPTTMYNRSSLVVLCKQRCMLKASSIGPWNHKLSLLKRAWKARLDVRTTATSMKSTSRAPSHGNTVEQPLSLVSLWKSNLIGFRYTSCNCVMQIFIFVFGRISLGQQEQRTDQMKVG